MRRLDTIAREISQDWRNVNYSAVPYLREMHGLGSIKDRAGADSGESIVRYFLGNAAAWRGETARRIKIELREMVA